MFDYLEPEEYFDEIVPNSATGFEGNTNSKPNKKQVNKAKKWIFTYNNYTLEEIGPIVLIFNSLCSKWVFQEETGENGTKHLQGCIFLKEKMRPTELKLNKKIHWEVMKGTDLEAITYCSKNSTRTGLIYKSDNVILPKPLKIINELRPFQIEIETMLLEEANDREIIWIYDEEGGKGKSSFCRYLIHKYEACYITEGKKTDIINMIYNYVLNQDLNMVLLDVPRDNKSVSYKSLEEIKNGIICNTKYETGMRLINPPHIVIFANFYPDTSKFTSDRWKIFTIDDEMNLRPYDVIEYDITNEVVF